MINEMSVVERVRAMCGGDFVKDFRAHVRKANAVLKRLHRAEASGDGAMIRTLQHRFLQSHSAKLCAVALNVEFEKGLHVTRLHELAVELDPFSDPGEPVKAWAKCKSLQGDWRPICEFGPNRRACQSLIAFMLDARFGIHPLDYMATGRGADVAVDRLKELLDAGYEWFVLADIENCFGSVKPEEAAVRLNLPTAVARNCLMIREETPLTLPSYIPGNTTSLAFSEAVRMGLPQGARPANRVMAHLLGPDFEALPQFEQGLFYGDDVALTASSRKKAEAIAEALREMLASHPAGPFRLKRLEIKHISEGFDYAKYHLRRDPIDGHIKIRPSSKSYAKFRDKVRTIVRDKSVQEVYAHVMSYRARWLAAFPHYMRTVDQEAQALILLWQFSIESLPVALRRKWERSCWLFDATNQPSFGAIDNWLDVAKPPTLAMHLA